MKALITTLLFIPIILFGQKLSMKKVYWKSSILFTAGLIQGSQEMALHNYDRFKRVHGIKNDQWFDYSKSYKNKYKPGTHEPRFKGSTGPLIVLTDFYHASKASWITLSGIGFSISIYEKRSWKQFAIETLCGMLIHKIGFLTSYNLIYK